MDGVHYGRFNWGVSGVGNLGESLPVPGGSEGTDWGTASTLEAARAACEQRLSELVDEAQ